MSWRYKFQGIIKPANIKWWRNSQLICCNSCHSINWVQFIRISSQRHPNRCESTCRSLISQRDSNVSYEIEADRYSYEIEANCQLVQDGVEKLKQSGFGSISTGYHNTRGTLKRPFRFIAFIRSRLKVLLILFDFFLVYSACNHKLHHWKQLKIWKKKRFYFNFE